MAVTLFRRHRKKCEAEREDDSYTVEAEERRKGWVKCSCTIYAHGTLGGKARKLATRCHDFESARILIAPFIAADSWDPDGSYPILLNPPDPPAPPAPTPDGLKIADAVKSFLAEHKSQKTRGGSIKNYKVVLGQFELYSKREGLRFIEEWNRPRVRAFRASLPEKLAPDTVRTKMGLLKAFFEQWVEDEVIAGNPARIRAKKNMAAKEASKVQRSPFEDEEINRMIDGAREMRQEANVVEIRPSRGGGAVRYDGEDLVDFILFSVHTGLRIADVCLFDIGTSLSDQGEVNLRPLKNGNWVKVPIPDWLQARIRRRALRRGPVVFGPYATENVESITHMWRDRLITLWDRTGPYAKKPTPHRFRHTFVRILLADGTPPLRVAELIGDTEEMVLKHYSDWVPGRQEALTRVVREAFRGRFHQA